MTTDTTPNTSGVADLLGWGDDAGAGYRRVYNAAQRLGITEWTPAAIQRFQVAAALTEASPELSRSMSPFAVIAAAVFANYRDPEPRSWAVYKESAVSYVLYPADLARAIGSGAVVAQIDKLWPETGGPDGE